jgi:hypothetical protein
MIIIGFLVCAPVIGENAKILLESRVPVCSFIDYFDWVRWAVLIEIKCYLPG